MASPFPDLPRSDCGYVPTVQAYSGPLVPKPLWTGAASYADPNYPSGGGPDDVPTAPPPIGQATPATISPPTQTSMGGGGGGGSDPEEYVFENGGSLSVNAGELMKPSGCVGWSVENSCLLLEQNTVNSNLVVFVCNTASVAPGALGKCYCLAGRLYRKTYITGTIMPQVYESLGSNAVGILTRHLVGFRAVAINGLTVHYARDIMPSQLVKVTSISGSTATAQTIVDPVGTLGGVDIPGTKLTS